MTTYILKVIGCSGLLLLIYHLFLEKEKMHVFNRFYLLFAVAFSLVIPLLHIQKTMPEILVSQVTHTVEAITLNPTVAQAQVVTEPAFSWAAVVSGIYCLVSAMLLLRFIKNIFSFFTLIRKSEIVKLGNSKLVLVENCPTPYSFLSYIFLNREDYKRDNIEEEILQHEMTHTAQRHSWDILFIEFVIVFAWVNPVLFLYRRAIQLNHEFLADESVIHSCDMHRYQNLLLNKTYRQNSLVLSSSFNYLLTKKRLIMMTRKTSFQMAVFKQLTLIPVFAICAFLLSDGAFAQTAKITLAETNPTASKTQASSIKSKSEQTLNPGMAAMIQNNILKMLSVPYPKFVPTQENLNTWLDSKTYNVWINGKKIENSELKKYSPKNFQNVVITPVNGVNDKPIYNVELTNEGC